MERNEIPVLIRSISAECDEHGREENRMGLTVPGTLCKRPDGWMLSYTEALQEDGGSNVVHEVRVLAKDRRVTVLRKGPYGMMMVLEQHVPYQGTYHTPYGDMSLEAYATRVQTELDEKRGKLRMEYQLRVGGGEAMMRRMSFEYSARA